MHQLRLPKAFCGSFVVGVHAECLRRPCPAMATDWKDAKRMRATELYKTIRRAANEFDRFRLDIILFWAFVLASIVFLAQAGVGYGPKHSSHSRYDHLHHPPPLYWMVDKQRSCVWCWLLALFIFCSFSMDNHERFSSDMYMCLRPT